ncbi:hypothetical protein ACJX0J_013356, partial [Zea mays]
LISLVWFIKIQIIHHMQGNCNTVEVTICYALAVRMLGGHLFWYRTSVLLEACCLTFRHRYRTSIFTGQPNPWFRQLLFILQAVVSGHSPSCGKCPDIGPHDTVVLFLRWLCVLDDGLKPRLLHNGGGLRSFTLYNEALQMPNLLVSI